MIHAAVNAPTLKERIITLHNRFAVNNVFKTDCGFTSEAGYNGDGKMMEGFETQLAFEPGGTTPSQDELKTMNNTMYDALHMLLEFRAEANIAPSQIVLLEIEDTNLIIVNTKRQSSTLYCISIAPKSLMFEPTASAADEDPTPHDLD